MVHPHARWHHDDRDGVPSLSSLSKTESDQGTSQTGFSEQWEKRMGQQEGRLLTSQMSDTGGSSPAASVRPPPFLLHSKVTTQTRTGFS